MYVEETHSLRARNERLTRLWPLLFCACAAQVVDAPPKGIAETASHRAGIGHPIDDIPTGTFVAVNNPKRRFRLSREGQTFWLESFLLDADGKEVGGGTPIEATIIEGQSEVLRLKNHHFIRLERHGDEVWLDIVFCYQKFLARPLSAVPGEIQESLRK